jgi:hypothetical protein
MRKPVKTHLPAVSSPLEWATTADGILYPSSRDGGQACVLFIGADQVCDQADWSGEDEPHRLFLEKGTAGSAVHSHRRR